MAGKASAATTGMKELQPYCSGDALKPSCGKKETVMNLISISPIARMWRLLSCNEVSITIVLKAKAFLLSDFTC